VDDITLPQPSGSFLASDREEVSEVEKAEGTLGWFRTTSRVVSRIYEVIVVTRPGQAIDAVV